MIGELVKQLARFVSARLIEIVDEQGLAPADENATRRVRAYGKKRVIRGRIEADDLQIRVVHLIVEILSEARGDECKHGDQRRCNLEPTSRHVLILHV